MNGLLILSFAFFLGCLNGLRSMAVPAVVAWAAYLGYLDLAATRLAFLGHPVTVGLLTLLGIAELIADKLPGIPPRTHPVGLLARLAMGVFTGGSLALAGGQAAYLGAIFGAVGAMVGAFGGLALRTRLVQKFKIPDFVVATFEDLVAVGGAALLVTALS